jgi:hypothetical protein
MLEQAVHSGNGMGYWVAGGLQVCLGQQNGSSKNSSSKNSSMCA